MRRKWHRENERSVCSRTTGPHVSLPLYMFDDYGLRPVFPFLHHDITSMPTEHQTVGKLLYTQWLALVATLVLNLVGCILLLIAGSSEGG